MSDVDTILRHKAFWPFFVHVNGEPLEGDVLRYFDRVRGKNYEYHQAVIGLPCGPTSSLDVAINPDLYAINLGLRNTETNTTREMGWWDDARWHPFALRWSELLALHRYWLGKPDLSVSPSVAFLLLAIFVGNGVDERERLPSRKGVIRGHYRQLQMFSDSEVAALTDKTLILPTEDDYHWTQDEKLGWLFGGEYPCYSLRNQEHSDGAEGQFPFSEWSSVVDRLPQPKDTE